MSANLAKRIVVAGIAIPAAVGVVYLGGWVLASAVAVLAVAGCHEVYRLAEQTGVRPLSFSGYAGALAVPLVGFASVRGGLVQGPVVPIVAGAAWLLLVMAVGVRRRAPTEKPLAAVAVTVFGVLYAAGLPTFLLGLRHGSAGTSRWAATWLVLLPLALIWICDTLAMAGGSLIGGRKLTPVVSPNKTWSGAIAGSIGALIVAPLYGSFILAPLGIVLTLGQLMVFGAVVSIVGQVGDVAESLFKREAGVKDSGSFFPGHGGVLDRLDSLYWAIPTAVLLLMWFGTL
jgi:phosphatidate cytidylyltransferase